MVRLNSIKIVSIILAIAFILGFVFFFMNFSEKIINEVTNYLDACSSESVFNTPPIALSDFLSITPLGNLNPPDHTIPTDHIYIVVKNNNEIDPSAARIVVAPGDITIQAITYQNVKKNGQSFSEDYSIDFSPCHEVQANFGHVTKLSPKLLSLFESARGNCETKHPRPEDEYTYCKKFISAKVSAGEILGEAGGGTPTGLDFRLTDRRIKPLTYANPNRYRDDQFYFACPLDLFDLVTKEKLYDFLGGKNGKRVIEPRCGEVNQDIPGTAQGNWMTGDGLIDTPESWSKSIALVHDNTDPNIGVFSIGGIISTPRKIQFNISHNGRVNRKFSEVKSDGNIYCYEDKTAEPMDKSYGTMSIPIERIIIQMTSDTLIMTEFQNGSCDNSYQFENPTTYER